MAVNGAAELGRLITETDLGKLDFYGESYLKQQIEIESEKHKREEQYRNYIAKAVELITLNTANLAAGERQGFAMPCTYQEFIEPQGKKQEEPQEQDPKKIKKKILDRFRRMRGDK